MKAVCHQRCDMRARRLPFSVRVTPTVIHTTTKTKNARLQIGTCLGQLLGQVVALDRGDRADRGCSGKRATHPVLEVVELLAVPGWAPKGDPARHTAHGTRHAAHATHHTANGTRHITCHTTHVTRHASRHTAHGTRHTPHATRQNQVVGFTREDEGSREKTRGGATARIWAAPDALHLKHLLGIK
jgi:hypothetical protein